MYKKIYLFALVLISMPLLSNSLPKDAKVLAAANESGRRKKSRRSVGPKPISGSMRDMSLAELEHNINFYRERGKKDTVIRYLEKAIPKHTDFVKIRNARLELADLYFDLGRHDKAGSIYTEYYEAYPGHTKAEYALVRAIMSQHKQVGACDQDNLLTKEVLDLSQQYLENKSYKKYRKYISELLSSCNQQLFDAEVKVFEYYFRRGNVVAAERRIKHIEDGKSLDKVTGAKQKVHVLKSLVKQAKAGKNPTRILRGANSLARMLADKDIAIQVSKKTAKQSFRGRKSYSDRF